MKISYNWLKDFVEITESPEELADLLTRIGQNVDYIDEIGGDWTKVVVGKVLTCEPVPETDHLSHCSVDAGIGETLSIVCGAPNVAAGQIVAVALVGAELAGGFRITRRKLRGVVSQGMICSEKELGISDEAAGIMVLAHPEGTEDSSPSGIMRGEIRIGAPLEEYIGQRDWVFDVEVTINRGDCLSHLGIAREIAAATGRELKIPPSEPVEINEDAAARVSVEILDPDKCPRYSARMITDIVIAPSPQWMQERLRAVGVRPISNIVDITNYVMLELGHPLHAFDHRFIAEGGIIVRTAEKGEKFVTLDDKKHTLAPTDLLIADKNGGVALAGVMGGLNSEIKEDTKDVLLECACFERVGIRVTSRDREISSESAHRFERGVDPEMIPLVINRTAWLIEQLAGGQVLKGIVDNYPKPWHSVQINLRPERLNSLLATNIPAKTIKDQLRGLGCVVKTGDTLQVTPPSWRYDLEREIDLVEEVARLYGYENITTATVSRVPLQFDDKREAIRRRLGRIRQAMVELGFQEVVTSTLVSGTEIERFPGVGEAIRLVNPLSEDLAFARTSLCITLLGAVLRNLSAGRSDISLFEWGNCFKLEDGAIRESQRLAAVWTGNIRPEFWGDSTRELNFHDLKGIVEQFTNKISLDKFSYFYYDIPEFISTGGRINSSDNLKGAPLAYFGRIAPEVASQFDISLPVWYFEFDGDRLLNRQQDDFTCEPLERYPAAHRDLSFIIGSNVNAAELEAILKTNGGDYLVEIELFDLFDGKGIPAGRKSLTYHLVFRSSERTLSDAEVDRSIETMIDAADKTVGAALRSN